MTPRLQIFLALALGIVACTAQQGAAIKGAAAAGEAAFASCALLYATSNELDAVTEPVSFLEGLAAKCGTATVETVIAALEQGLASAPDAGAVDAGPADVVQITRLRKAHRLARSAQLAAQVTR